MRKTKDYKFYFSPRGIPLIYCGPPQQKPVLTCENYMKWYDLFLVMPDGSVTALPHKVSLDIVEKSNGYGLLCDHCVYPGLIPMVADLAGASVDGNSFDMIVGRWENDIKNTWDHVVSKDIW